VLVAVASIAQGARETRRPNVVFILVDDLGWADIGAFNPRTFYDTPNINRLAAEGMMFTNGYAANPVCSPTRYSIMTGKYPTRVGATNYFSGTREGRFAPAPLEDRMPGDEVTLAEALAGAGYKSAFIGKWHLGPVDEYWPRAQGFDVNIAGDQRGAPSSFFAPYNLPKLEDGPEGEHLTARLTDEALRLMEQFEDGPFLLYLAYYTVHVYVRRVDGTVELGLEAPDDLVAAYVEKARRLDDGPEFAEEEQVWPIDEPRRVRIRQNHPTYAAMVESMDRNVGRVLDKLDELGLSDNTVVVFTSDNGGLSTAEGHPTSNLPLRGGKGWVYEGGIREPFIIKAPNANSGVSAFPVSSIDFYPTIMELAGVSTGHRVDGESLVPLLRGERALDRTALYWHYPHYGNQGGFPGGAIRMGRYKLVERYEDGRVHLYDLETDLGERNDLASDHGARVDDMRKRLHAWYRDVDAKFLSALPDGPAPWQPY
jgi:arylsulfatase A-like enzyme